MNKFVQAMIHVSDSGLVYVVDRDGRITPISLPTYEALDIGDPRLERVAWTRRQAELVSLRVRGIETGFEVEQMRN
jgi:hypothetical protein